MSQSSVVRMSLVTRRPTSRFLRSETAQKLIFLQIQPEARQRTLKGNLAPGYLTIWQALCDGALSWEEFAERFKAQSQLTYLSIDTTAGCDLTCEGCYYHPQIPLNKEQVSLSDLVNAVSQAIDKLGTRAVVLAGKEPLLNAARVWNLLDSLSTMPGRQHVRVGMICNGRHVERHWNRFLAADTSVGLDFVDISFDSGDPLEHDQIRGVPGTFERSFRALTRCSQELTHVRVGTSCVLRERNLEGLLELIRRTTGLRVAHWITPLQPPPFSNASAPTVKILGAFLAQLRTLLRTELCKNSHDVTVSIPGIYIYDLVKDGELDLTGLKEDHDGQFAIIENIGRSCMNIHLAILPDNGWRQARILADGSYLSHIHFLEVPNPQQLSIGNISTSSIIELWNMAIASNSIADRLLNTRAEHDCRSRGCWSHCLGGWTVSENSLLTHKSLHQQPELCQRPRLCDPIRQPLNLTQPRVHDA